MRGDYWNPSVGELAYSFDRAFGLGDLKPLWRRTYKAWSSRSGWRGVAVTFGNADKKKPTTTCAVGFQHYQALFIKLSNYQLEVMYDLSHRSRRGTVSNRQHGRDEADSTQDRYVHLFGTQPSDA